MFVLSLFVFDIYKEINPTTVFILKSVYSALKMVNTKILI